MSQFCKQCSVKLFGEDSEDFKRLSTKEDTARGEFPVVVCESCGLIQVDHAGRCITEDCLGVHAHEEKKINFKMLLYKYMGLVKTMEGVDCIDVDGQRESLEVGITFEEWSVLEGMHRELSE